MPDDLLVDLGDEPEFPDYEIVTSEEADLEAARARAVAEGDADAAWELMTPAEREQVFKRLMARKERERVAMSGASRHAVGSVTTGLKARRRARAKTARAARKRNRK